MQLAALLFGSLCGATLVTFSNLVPRRDTAGRIMNAHDGCTRRYTPGAPFYVRSRSSPGSAHLPPFLTARRLPSSCK
jgi:hypothetical protein